MQKYISVLVFLVLSLSLSAQKQAQTPSQKSTQIKGELKNNSGFEKVYLENILSEVVIDSAVISRKGKFSFELNLEKSDFFKLKVSDEMFLMYIPEPGEKAEIILDTESPETPVIQGSKHTELVYSTLGASADINQKIEDYRAQMELERKTMIRKMIDENPTSLACLFFINELDVNEDFPTYKKLSEGLAAHTENYLVADLNKIVSESSKLAIGTQAPEIELQTPLGETKKLSDLRGSYVLIDFWAAWCRPCRAESPNLVKLYDKYHKKGFTIYSVSLDRDKGSWLKAIKDDELGKWTHVSDLMYWSSKAAVDYGVESIPHTILIDKNGIIIAKDLRGEDLEKKLAEILKD